jgi:transposase
MFFKFAYSTHITTNKKVRRSKLLVTVLNLDGKRIVMEACYSSSYWVRLFQKHGFHVDLIPTHKVKPFAVGNKNDHNDAIAIAEASMRPKATFVAIKTLAQQDIKSLERIRERLMKNHTALANQLRCLLAEYGVIIEKKCPYCVQLFPLFWKMQKTRSHQYREPLLIISIKSYSASMKE